ncbi:MAG: ribosome biogenesis GTPase Der [Elusimicrobia bacterium RIFOXYB2_FULL_49_7]|nr:MAG: ribosome biogenesis GTPase Der [Elusimicrobia bacterium RIFOXYB2_FULL_49_7]
MLPIVALVGRPNVGKSSLFNRLLKRKIAITSDISGTTRDRNYQAMEWNHKHFLVADTGGLLPGEKEKVVGFIRQQVLKTAEEAELILLIVDAQTGPTDLDLAVARELKRYRHKLLLVANKADNESLQSECYRFLQLGLGESFPVSATHGIGAADLLDVIAEKMPQMSEVVPVPIIRIALLGRPNSGKSTLVNALTGQENAMTDDRPGTTRDSVDTILDFNGKRFCLIDTAGLRKAAKTKEDIEFYSILRTEQSLERCDIAAVLVDMEKGVEEQDVNVMQMAIRRGKGLFVVLNKWDTVEKDSHTFDKLVKELDYQAAFLAHYPKIAVSALTKLRATRVLDMACQIHDHLFHRFDQNELENFLTDTALRHPHPMVFGKTVSFYSILQRENPPPFFDITTSHPKDIRENYERYLENKFYEHFNCLGCPIRFRYMRKKKRGMRPLNLIAEKE